LYAKIDFAFCVQNGQTILGCSANERNHHGRVATTGAQGKKSVPDAKRKKGIVKKSIAPINRPRPLHQEVVDRLRDMIIEGEIGIGDRLHEANLSEILNVSRTPLREAVKLLATEGLVELLPGRGARVAALSPDDIEELFEVIGGLERLAAELAATRMTARDLERLQRMHEKMSVHFDNGERHEYFAINHAIHEAIVAMAKNAMLTAAHTALMAKARRGRYTALASDARWTEAMGEHETLMDAFAKRDGKLAGEILLAHDIRTGKTTKELLRAKRL
jgi:DNA-binding GntR family transcriptional regulator